MNGTEPPAPAADAPAGTQPAALAGEPAAPDWVEIRRLYCETELTVSKIALKFGIDIAKIYHRRAKEGWPKRSDKPEFIAAMAAARPRGGSRGAR